ncbi:HNH endonuclease signature motif containing protein [Cryobacterium zongtaii]
MITARDGGCIIPGCDCPPQWTEVHHVVPWQVGGKTHASNGVLLCWYHHHTIDSGGWRIRMVGGKPQVKAPHWIDPPGTWRTPEQHRAHDPKTRPQDE